MGQVSAKSVNRVDLIICRDPKHNYSITISFPPGRQNPKNTCHVCFQHFLWSKVRELRISRKSR